MYVQLLIIILGFLALKWFAQVGTEVNKVLQHRRYIIFMMILLILQSGLRHWAVGPDTYQYYVGFYLGVEQSTWQRLWKDCLDFINNGTGKDPGYRLLLKAIQYVLPTYQLYLLGLATFVFYGLGKLFMRYTSSNYEVLVAMALYQCLYYSFFSITGLRQTMATGFLFLAIPFAVRRKPWQFALLVLVAATQHKSALLFMPFYFLSYMKHSRLMLVASLIMFIPMWVYGSQIAGWLMMGNTFEQYLDYLQGYEGAGAYGFAAYIILLGILLIYYHKAVVTSIPDTNLVLNSVAVAIVLTPLTMIDPSNMRIVQYYSIFALFALPWVISKMNFANAKDRYIIVAILLTIYTLTRGSEYAFFWQEMALGANYQ